jgi:hypothetical protein
LARSAPNRLDCCRPFLKWVGPPKRYEWVHSPKFCTVSPGEGLSEAELDIAAPRPVSAASTRYSEAEQARHEATAHADLDESGCPAHGFFKPWRDCPECNAWVQAFKEGGFA